MLLIFCLILRKDQLYGKPGKYFLARGPVRLGVPRAPMQVKTLLFVGAACSTIRTCIAASTRCTTSGRLRSASRRSTRIPWSTCSATCCRPYSARCSWARTLPPLCSSLSWRSSRRPSHTADITSRSCRRPRRTISTIRSMSSYVVVVVVI